MWAVWVLIDLFFNFQPPGLHKVVAVSSQKQGQTFTVGFKRKIELVKED